MMTGKVPRFASDQEAIDFLEQDLSGLDSSQFKLVSFVFSAKAAQIDMRVPQPLLDAVKVQGDAMTNDEAP